MSVSRRAGLALGVGAIAGLTGVGVAWRQWSMTAGPDTAEPLWRLRFARPEGGEYVMANFHGKPLILNFWATWCVPCIRELPALQRFQRDFGASGWRVLALAVDSPVPVLEFIAKFKLDLPVAMAGVDGLELMRVLGNAQGGLPFSVAIDATGRIIDRKLGETKYDDLSRWAAAAKS